MPKIKVHELSSRDIELEITGHELRALSGRTSHQLKLQTDVFAKIDEALRAKSPPYKWNVTLIEDEKGNELTYFEP